MIILGCIEIKVESKNNKIKGVEDMIKDVIKRVKDMMEFNNRIKFNNETIKNAIMDALDKMERGIEISEVDRNEFINVLLKGDRDFGITNGNRKYTEEELQYSAYGHIFENYKCYIGQTKQNPKDRWDNGNGYETQVVYNPIKKYGWDNISHVVICNGLTQEQVNDIEVALIYILKSTNIEEFGYNVANGGNGKGKTSEETRKKLSEAHKGKHHSEETRKKLSENRKGMQHSEETRKKLSESNKGKHHSEETRKKFSENRKGKYTGENNPMYGKHLSEESKKKISEARKGKYVGENSPSAKKVFCSGMIFPTGKLCAKFYNVSPSTMCMWLQGKVKKIPSEFIEKGLRYATQDDINTYPLYIEEEQNQQD